MDSRVTSHAKVIVTHSTKIKEGDMVLINVGDYGLELAIEIYKEAAKLGASPLITITPSEAVRGYYMETPEEYLSLFPRHYYELVKASDVSIRILSASNTRYLSSVEPKRISERSKATKEISDTILKKRWCVTLHPTEAYAQEAEMSLKEYQDFVYGAVLVDWEKELAKMEKLQEVMNRTDKVELIGEDTNLTMSIKGMHTVIDDATHNLPGGEVFTAPIPESVNGEVYFDLPAIRYGKEVTDIYLRFEKGIIVEARASKNEDLLHSMINTDEGSKKLGELGIGTNKKINRFTRNILFDEKMGNTFHLAIGRAYEECGGKNYSAIHWDMIKTMNYEEGDMILFDGKKITDLVPELFE